MSGIGFSGEKVLADFRPVYWSAKWFPAENATAAKLGTWFDVSHPVFAGFPTEDFTDWQWFGIVGGVVAHRLCGLPADYRPFALSVSDFRMPLTRKRGDRSFAEVDVDPEDLLDGKLEIEIRQLTGQNFNIDRVRVVPR